jgi:hypothetical protein
MEMYGFHLFKIDITGMMSFDRFALIFNTIAMACTFIFFLLSAKEMEKVGLNYSDYFRPDIFYSLRHHTFIIFQFIADSFPGH